MFELGRHGGYILASYIVTVLILTATVWQTVSQYRSVKRRFFERGGRDDA